MIGFGYDSHRLAIGKLLVLGGIKIDSPLGTVAHSDGDALFHAVCDALLGAASLGDIGEHFPNTDPRYKNADSETFMREVMKLIFAKKLKIVNIDAVIILEEPKLSKYKHQIKNNIARICAITPEQINIKAKTNEKLGFVGKKEGVAIYCVCQLEKI